jgi:hypothetical protein
MATKGMWDTAKDAVGGMLKSAVNSGKVKTALEQEAAKRAVADRAGAEEPATPTAPAEKDEPVKEIRFAKGGMVRRGYGKARGS